MNNRGSNHPFVVWAASFLMLTSIFEIAWSLLLFFTVGDMLQMTKTDIINAIALLSGIMMVPPVIYMLKCISNNRLIDGGDMVACCPLWMCIVCIILINAVGAVMCSRVLLDCPSSTNFVLTKSMEHYRNVPQYKRFMDSLQWSLQCCGLNSYKDWFDHDWYDKIRDYEWDTSSKKRDTQRPSNSDSVPQSCCKSGSCISNYLQELGTFSINTGGCARVVRRVVMISMTAHLILFFTMMVVEVLLLSFILNVDKQCQAKARNQSLNIHRIMSINDNFDASSCSYQFDDDSDEERRISTAPELKRQIFKDITPH